MGILFLPLADLRLGSSGDIFKGPLAFGGFYDPAIGSATSLHPMESRQDFGLFNPGFSVSRHANSSKEYESPGSNRSLYSLRPGVFIFLSMSAAPVQAIVFFPLRMVGHYDQAPGSVLFRCHYIYTGFVEISEKGKSAFGFSSYLDFVRIDLSNLLCFELFEVSRRGH